VNEECKNNISNSIYDTYLFQWQNLAEKIKLENTTAKFSRISWIFKMV